VRKFSTLWTNTEKKWRKLSNKTITLP